MTALIGLKGASSGFARRAREAVRALLARGARFTSSDFVLRGAEALRVVFALVFVFVACRGVRFAIVMGIPFLFLKTTGSDGSGSRLRA